MTDLLRYHAAYTELLQSLAELELVSHAPTQSLEPSRKDTSESMGGRKPPGGNVDKPESGASLDERMAWKDSYHRRTPEHFHTEIAKCETIVRLVVLRDECRETVSAWKRSPIGGREPEFGSPQWKRWVAESKEDAGDLSRRFNCSRRYINMVRQQYRTA